MEPNLSSSNTLQLGRWGEPEQAAQCAEVCHATQTMNSNMVCDLLSLWLHMHGLSFIPKS